MLVPLGDLLGQLVLCLGFALAPCPDFNAFAQVLCLARGMSLNQDHLAYIICRDVCPSASLESGSYLVTLLDCNDAHKPLEADEDSILKQLGRLCFDDCSWACPSVCHALGWRLGFVCIEAFVQPYTFCFLDGLVFGRWLGCPVWPSGKRRLFGLPFLPCTGLK